MPKQQHFVHDIAKHLTNVLLIIEDIGNEYGDTFPPKLKENFVILNSELDKMTKIIRETPQ